MAPTWHALLGDELYAAAADALAPLSPARVKAVVLGCTATAPDPQLLARTLTTGDLLPIAVQGVLMLGPELRGVWDDVLARVRAVTPGAAVVRLPYAGELPAGIVWTPQPLFAFTDGACSKNGFPGARAGYAAVVEGGAFALTELHGEVAPSEYALGPEGCDVEAAPGVPVAPSNNRGELLGIIYCLAALYRGEARGRVPLYSDSLISVRTLREWRPARVLRGTAGTLKNPDLLDVATRLLERLALRGCVVELVHMRAHRAAPKAGAPELEHRCWRGNARADRLANQITVTPHVDYRPRVASPLGVVEAMR